MNQTADELQCVVETEVGLPGAAILFEGRRSELIGSGHRLVRRREP